MTVAEAVKAACYPDRQPTCSGRWVTDGWFCVPAQLAPWAPMYQGAPFALAEDRDRKAGEYMTCATREPVAERAGWRRPQVVETNRLCSICRGHGVHQCDCGDEHSCADCKGTGILEGTVVSDLGQLVFDGAKGEIVLAGRFAALADVAASVVRICKDEGRYQPLGFLDTDGSVIAVVMPMKETPKAPGVAA